LFSLWSITDGLSKEYSQLDEEVLPQEEENLFNYSPQLLPIDSSRKKFYLFIKLIISSLELERCVINSDCGENMVCLSEFCECAKQKYKRIPGPRCVARKMILLLFSVCRCESNISLKLDYITV
jgi:hypothetical protein